MNTQPCCLYSDNCKHDGHRHLWAIHSVRSTTGEFNVNEDASNLMEAQRRAHRLGMFLGGTVSSLSESCVVAAVVGKPDDGHLRVLVALDLSARDEGGRPKAPKLFDMILDALNNDPEIAAAAAERGLPPMGYKCSPGSAEDRAQLSVAYRLSEAMEGVIGQGAFGGMMALPPEVIEAAVREEEARASGVPDAMPGEES